MKKRTVVIRGLETAVVSQSFALSKLARAALETWHFSSVSASRFKYWASHDCYASVDDEAYLSDEADVKALKDSAKSLLLELGATYVTVNVFGRTHVQKYDAFEIIADDIINGGLDHSLTVDIVAELLTNSGLKPGKNHEVAEELLNVIEADVLHGLKVEKSTVKLNNEKKLTERDDANKYAHGLTDSTRDTVRYSSDCVKRAAGRVAETFRALIFDGFNHKFPECFKPDGSVVWPEWMIKAEETATAEKKATEKK